MLSTVLKYDFFYKNMTDAFIQSNKACSYSLLSLRFAREK